MPKSLFSQADMSNVNFKCVDDDKKAVWSRFARAQALRFSD